MNALDQVRDYIAQGGAAIVLTPEQFSQYQALKSECLRLRLENEKLNAQIAAVYAVIGKPTVRGLNDE